MGVLTKYVYSIRTLLFVGTMLRLGFLVYGIWQDKTMRVKYTDIDYHVFTDAARYVVLVSLRDEWMNFRPSSCYSINIIKWPMPLGARPRSIKNVNKIL